MNGRAAKESRKAARETAAALQPRIDAALTNETVTRERVAQLERVVAKMISEQVSGDSVEALERAVGHLEIGARSAAAFRGRSFAWRFRWLILGR